MMMMMTDDDDNDDQAKREAQEKRVSSDLNKPAGSGGRRKAGVLDLSGFDRDLSEVRK